MFDFYRSQIASIENEQSDIKYKAANDLEDLRLKRQYAVYGVLKEMRQGVDFPTFLLGAVNPEILKFISIVKDLIDHRDVQNNRRNLLQAEKKIFDALGTLLPGPSSLLLKSVMADGL